MPNIPKGMEFVDSPYVDLAFVMADMEEDDPNLAINSLNAKVEETLQQLN